MASTAAKLRAVGEGAVIGGGTTAALGVVATQSLRALTRAAPRLGMVAGRAVPAIGLAIMAGGAVYGGVRAYRHGDNVLVGALKGSLGIGGSSAETMDEAQTRLGKNLGGSPNDLKLAAENSRAAMKRAKTNADRNYHERRALAMEREFERVTGQHLGPTQPNAPAKMPASMPAPAVPPANETVGQRLKRRAGEAVENALFGEKKAKGDDALASERRNLEGQVGDLRKRMDEEFSKRGGKGPKYDGLKRDLDEKQGQLTALTGKQAAKEREELAALRQVAAFGVGAVVGLGLGHLTERSAKAVVKTAEAGIVTLSKRASVLVSGSKKGVIAGTIEGDKAAAAVAAAKTAMNTAPVSRVTAFGLPALNLAHGTAAYAYAATHPDDPASPMLRAEGAAAIAAGVFGVKAGLKAVAMRPNISPAIMDKLHAAEKRLMREARGSGPAGVAIAKAKAAVGTAAANANAAVKVAGNRAGGRVAASQISAKGASVKAGANLGVAKAQGASRVGVAEARGKQAVTRQVKRGQTSVYKDTWQDSRGKVYHRKDMSVRRGKAPAKASAKTTRTVH